MYLKIMIDLDHPIMQHDEDELPRALHRLAEEYRYSLRNNIPVKASNGNYVGYVELVHDFIPLRHKPLPPIGD